MTQYLQDTSDEKINEMANNLHELYINSDIINYVHNGKALPFKYQSLLNRQIAGIYSNIENKPSVQSILSNAIKFSLNLSQHTKSTGELKIYRESCERFKLALSLLMRKKQQGLLVDDTEIETKTKEIKMLEQKMNEIANTSTFKPEINKKILTNAETIYNIMLRNDRVPKLLFIKLCKKLNYHFNYSERFIDEYEKPNIMKQKSGTYVPPAFRTNSTNSTNSLNTNFQKMKQIKEEENDDKDDIKDNNNDLSFLTFTNTSTTTTTTKNIGAWAVKSKLIFKETKSIPATNDNFNTNDNKTDTNTNKIIEDVKLSSEWENDYDF
jgi:hypothetical protein